MLQKPLVTILVPHYKTLELTKLCLRLLRKYTDSSLAKVIVIDNDSADASTDYLRSLNWLELIERPKVLGESGPTAHANALDLGLSKTTTPYVLSIHTDTLVKNNQWLPFLIQQIEQAPTIAGVGSWKLEDKTWIRRSLKQIEVEMQKRIYRFLGKSNHNIAGVGKNHYYLRSHCALYRTELIHQVNASFADKTEPLGKVLHQKLINANYEMIFLPSETLNQYVSHVNHATIVLNPQLADRQKTITQGSIRIAKALKQFKADQILADASLDQ